MSIVASSTNRLPSDYTSNGYDYYGATASAPDNGTDQMTTTIKYIANVYYVGDTPPPSVVFACDFNDTASASASLGGDTQVGGSAFGHGGKVRTREASTQHLQRTADYQQSVPDPDEGTRHSFYPKSINWIETSPGYFVGHVLLETITASADASYSNGLPTPPPGQSSLRHIDDGAGGSSYEALMKMTVTEHGV